MAPKDDPETAALKKELTDLIEKFKVWMKFKLKLFNWKFSNLFIGRTKESSRLYNIG